MTTPSSILIVRLSAIGDVIHTLPVLDALRQAFPDARLGWLVEELSAPLLRDHPQLNQLYVIPKKKWRGRWAKAFLPEIRPFFQAIRRDGWDVAIDTQGLTKSGLATWGSGAPLRVGYGDHDAREINRLFTNRTVVPPADASHVVQRNLSLLRGLRIDPTDAHGVLWFSEQERDAMRDRIRQETAWDGVGRLCGLNLGAGWSSKRWAPERYGEVGARLANETGLVPLILWGPGEEPLRDAAEKALQDASVTHVIAPKTSVRELAVLIGLCDLFIGGDTGPSHMAAMQDIPTVSIFGASDPRRNRPWPVDSGPALQREELPCVPCWKRVCPLGGDAHLACLRTLTVDQVVQAAIVRLSRD